MDDIGQAPPLTPVGQGIGKVAEEPSLASVETLGEMNEGWIGGSADYFRDARASRRGDLLTVNIQIDDEAALNSTSNRSRNSSADAGLAFNYDVMDVIKADMTGEGEIDSNTSSAGQGSTARSERIELSIAAMVTKVMPNGYLLIEGSQEVLVNFEQRTLHVTGLIRPIDISPNNSISYEKIAEARISYGGKGRISEVQQPAWGQQIWDGITPF